jgi:mono/diheme cytochrome c family protein
MARPVRVALLVLSLAFVPGCAEPALQGPQVLGGVEIPVDVLERGRDGYLRYCVTCHGEQGDGRGIAATSAWPPPRDFRDARFKFAGIEDRGLPDDAELARIIRHGLAGTGMKPWDVPEPALLPIIHYIKTFSPEGRGFRSERLEVKAPRIPPDPLAAAGDEARTRAIERGARLYHSYFECAQCHPSYVEPERFAAWDAEQRADAPYAPVPKWAPDYQSVLVPPDFLRHPMRSVRRDGAPGGGHRADDLYRVIAYGLQGPMPGYGHLGEEDVWAVAYYTKWLLDLAGTPGADELRERLAR